MEYTMLRIWEKTRRILRIVAAHTDESMIELVDRLVREEAERRRIPLEHRGE